MSNKLYEETDVQAIANAIRSKNGSSDTYKVSEMAQAVLDIPQGTTPTGTKQITISSAGTTTENVSAYANAEITVPQGQYKPQLSATITPSISVSNGGLITASNITQVLQDWTKDTFNEGYVEASDVSAKATVTGGSATHQLNTVNGQTVTPTTSTQYIAVQGDYVLGAINVAPIPSQYIVPTGTKSITANGTGIDVKAYEYVDVSVSGGGGDEVIVTQVISNSSGNICLNDVLEALENAGYTLTYTDCILKFRAKGASANSSPPNNYTYNNHTFLVKDGAIWNVAYNRCAYKTGVVAPDAFTNQQAYETNNAIQNSGNIIDANHKIVNTYASNFQGIGGTGTTVTLMEIPVDWSDFFTTI